MKAAIILGGGRGTRLNDIAGPYAKTLLPVGDLPVIAYAARAVAPHVDRLVLVAHPSTATAVYAATLRGLGTAAVDSRRVFQHEPLGMADAIHIGLEALDDDMPVVVMCGDNIVLDGRNVGSVLEHVAGHDPRGLAWTYREVPLEEARRFSVLRDDGGGHGRLVEKPAEPPSNICWCGPIAFRSAADAHARARQLAPSARGEYEASDLINSYLQSGDASRVPLVGPWFDVGTPASLAEARQYMLAHA